MSEIASAYISLIPSFKGGASKIESELRGPTESAGRTVGSRFGKMFASASASPMKAIGTSLVGMFAASKVKDFLADSIGEAREAQQVGALTASVIKATGGAANVTAGQVGSLAGAISKKIAVDDEAIQSGENMLLTFKGIRNEAGKGNDIFNQTTQAMTDVAAAMAASHGGAVDYKATAIQLGKALNDPIHGTTALTKVGVTFDDQQKKQIKTLVESGRTLAAQKIILRELKSEYGGTARSQVTAGKQMSVAFGNLKEQIGTALLPVLDKAEREVTTKVIPAVSRFVTQMQTGKGPGGDFARIMGNIGDAARDVAKVGVGVARFFGSLPGPLRTGVLEGAAFALVLSKLRTGIAALPGLMSKLGGAAKLAGGVGGMMLLTDSLHRSTGGMRTFESAAGGALMGFSVGGPWGAAIGGGIGLISSLGRTMKQTVPKADLLRQANLNLAGSFDEITDKATKATRSQITDNLAKKGLLGAARNIGVSNKTLIDSIMGVKGAQDRLNAAIAKNYKLGGANASDADERRSQAAQKLRIALRGLERSYQGNAEAAQRNTLANRGWIGSLNGLPKSIKVIAHQEGFKGTIGEVRALARAQHLTPKKINILARAEGVELTRKQLRGIAEQAKGVNRVRPDLKGWVAGIATAVNKGAAVSTKQEHLIIDKLEAIKKARPDMSKYVNSVENAVGQAHLKAGGSTKVGNELKTGLLSGMYGTGPALASIMSSAVTQAIAAARAAAHSKSPSRKTMALGRDLGEGLRIGIMASSPRVNSAASGIVLGALGSMSTHTSSSGYGARVAAQQRQVGATFQRARQGAASTPQAPAAPTFSGRIWIDNWEDGTGYFESVADDRIGARRALDETTRRAGRR